MQVTITRHADIRMQQRCIPPMVIDWLIDYGLSQEQGNGTLVYFNKKSKRLIRQYAGPQAMSVFEKYHKAYAVVSANDGSVITTGWKSQRFQSKRKQYAKGS